MSRFFPGLVTIIFFLISTNFANDLDIRTFSWSQPQSAENTGLYSQTITLEHWEMFNTFSDKWQKVTAPFTARDTERLSLRSSFKLPELLPSQKVSIVSHGFKNSVQIFLNGSLLHFHSNDNTPFEVEINADLVRPDAENMLEIELTDPQSTTDGFPLYANLFNPLKTQGITRPIFIAISGQTSIGPIEHRVSVSGKKASVNYSYPLTIPSDLKRCRIEETIYDPNGKIIVNRYRNIASSNQNGSGSFNLPANGLWSPDNPVIYRWMITLKAGQQVLQRREMNIGFRLIEYKNNVFYLNNQNIKIHGINYYENLDVLNGANLRDIIKSDLSAIKELGCNAIRLPHYLPDPGILNTADSLGLLVFGELPIWRFPGGLFLDDNLLAHAKTSILNLKRFYSLHPSLVAVGTGQEIPIHESSAQKFMYILNGAVETNLKVLTYLSPIPAKELPREMTTDFYVLDLYRPIQSMQEKDNIRISSFALAGKLGIVRSEDVYTWDSAPADQKRKFFVKREIEEALYRKSMQGGFIESFSDWRAQHPLHLTINSSDKTLMPSGLYTAEHQPKHWLKKIDNLWLKDTSGTLTDTSENKKTNFFSILIFFVTILFFGIYRQRPRLRDNMHRAFRHSYGFFVDMRERRIIPLFNSLLIGGFAALLLATFLASYLYFYFDSYRFQEIISIFLIPPRFFDTYLLISSHPAILTGILFLILFLYPVFVSIILKMVSLLIRSNIRYRQGLAIGLWSGVPLLFLLPFSLVGYHLLSNNSVNTILLYLLIFFIIWAHLRIINGIRVLFIARPIKVFLIMLLSYVVPFIIFWAVFKPATLWYEYLSLLFQSGSLF